MVEAGFSHINALLTKQQQNRLDVDECGGGLRLTLTHAQLNIDELIESHQLHPSH